MFVTYKLTARVGRAIIGLTCVVSLALVMSCGGNEVCEPGKTRTCPCVDGTEGVQSCRDDGTAWRQCRCGSPADTSPDADGSSTMDTNDQSDVMPDAGPADTGGTDASSDTTTDTTDGGGTDEPEDPLAPSIHQIGDDQPQVTHAIAPLGDGTSAVGGHFAGELLGVEASASESGFVVTYDRQSRVVSQAVPESANGSTRVTSLRTEPGSRESAPEGPSVVMAGAFGSSDATRGFLAAYNPSQTGDWQKKWSSWPVAWKTELGASKQSARVLDIAVAPGAETTGDAYQLFAAGTVVESTADGEQTRPAVWSLEIRADSIVDQAMWVGGDELGADLEPVRIVADGQGGLLVMGTTDENGSTATALTRLDETGTRAWRSVLAAQSGGSVSAEGQEMAVERGDDDTLDRILIVGAATGSLAGAYNAGGKDAFVAAFGEDGTRRGVDLAGTPAEDEATAILSFSREAYGIQRAVLYGRSASEYDDRAPADQRSGLFSMTVSTDDEGNVELGELDADNHLGETAETETLSLHGGGPRQGPSQGTALGDLNGDNKVALGDLNGDNKVALGDLNGDNKMPQPMAAGGTTTGTSVAAGASASENDDEDVFFSSMPSRQVDFSSWTTSGGTGDWTTEQSGRVARYEPTGNEIPESASLNGGSMQFDDRSLLGTLAFDELESDELSPGAHAAGVILGANSPQSQKPYLVWSWTTSTADASRNGFVLARVEPSAQVDGLTTNDLQTLAGQGDAEILATRTCEKLAWEPGESYQFGILYESNTVGESTFGLRLPGSGIDDTQGLRASGSVIPDDLEVSEASVFAQTDVASQFENWRLAHVDAADVLEPDEPLTCGSCGVGCTYDNAVAGCQADSCTLKRCKGGWADCDGREINGCETPTGSNPFHCGSCGNTCGRSEVCNSGSCEETPNLAMGKSHACLLQTDGDVHCWGDNRRGSVGIGEPSNERVTTPRQVTEFAAADDIAAGKEFSCALKSDGTVWCWGDNRREQVSSDLPEAKNIFAPVQVPNISDAVGISAGLEYACARIRNGTIKCWGRNKEGQIGDGTTQGPRAPTEVTGISDAAELSAGRWSACARLSNGEVECWGEVADRDAGLGNGRDQSSSVPVEVSNLSNAERLADGYDRDGHCAIRTDGGISCWGTLEQSQSSTTPDQFNSKSPTEIGTYDDVVDMTISGKFACLLRTDGSVDCFGNNEYGNLGDGTYEGATVTETISRATRVEGFDAYPIEAVGIGRRHGCAADSTGEVYCWGTNKFGNIGDGQLTQRLTATPTVDFGPTRSELGKCFDGVDNDGDGAIDCADDDCATDLGTQTGRAIVTDQLCGGGDYSFGSCISNSQQPGSDGSEKRYVWEAPSSGTYQFDSKTSQATTYLYARKNTCAGNELACSIDGPSNSRQAAITLDVDAGDRIVLFADLEYTELNDYSRCEPDDGEFVLNITKQ